MAGVSGFEPERSVLETLILPLYYTPNKQRNYNIQTLLFQSQLFTTKLLTAQLFTTKLQSFHIIK